jgi:putative transposase
MNLTHTQISELLLNIANSENGTNLLMQMTLDAFMKSERHLHQQENPEDSEMDIVQGKQEDLVKKWF